MSYRVKDIFDVDLPEYKGKIIQVLKTTYSEYERNSSYASRMHWLLTCLVEER